MEAVGEAEIDTDVLVPLREMEEEEDGCNTNLVLVDIDPGAEVVNAELDVELAAVELCILDTELDPDGVELEMPSGAVTELVVGVPDEVVLVSSGAATSSGATDRHSEGLSSETSRTTKLPLGVRQNSSYPST